MLGIGATLVGLGLGFVKDLIMNNGEDLVKEGIKKVTGIDLNKKKLTQEEIDKISQFKIEIEKLDFEKLKLEIDSKQQSEQQITDRWKSDNSSDSRIAKMTRPMLVIYLMFVVTLLAILDGNLQGFDIKEHWVVLFTTLAVTALGGYFTLRTYEKRTGTSKWSKGEQDGNRH